MKEQEGKLYGYVAAASSSHHIDIPIHQSAFIQSSHHTSSEAWVSHQSLITSPPQQRRLPSPHCYSPPSHQ